MHALRKAPAAYNNAGTLVTAGVHLGQQSGLNLPEEDIIRLALGGLCILALLIIQHPDLQQSQSPSITQGCSGQECGPIQECKS